MNEDLGLTVASFEFWKTINYFSYEDLAVGAIEEDNFLVIALDKMLVQTAMSINKDKYRQDFNLIKTRLMKIKSNKFKKISWVY